jgi:hypothetical protein
MVAVTLVREISRLLILADCGPPTSKKGQQVSGEQIEEVALKHRPVLLFVGAKLGRHAKVEATERSFGKCANSRP